MTVVPVISLLRHTVLFFVSFFHCAWFLSYKNHLHWDLNPRQIFFGGGGVFGHCSINLLVEMDNFVLDDVLSCLVSEILETPLLVFKCKMLYWSSDLVFMHTCMHSYAHALTHTHFSFLFKLHVCTYFPSF